MKSRPRAPGGPFQNGDLSVGARRRQPVAQGKKHRQGADDEEGPVLNSGVAQVGLRAARRRASPRFAKVSLERRKDEEEQDEPLSPGTNPKPRRTGPPSGRKWPAPSDSGRHSGHG